MTLTIRTDKPEAEVGLFFRAGQERQYTKWQAHRELSKTIHIKIEQLLRAENMDWSGISGIVYYKGPGSFTGLRIGLAVANSLAYSLAVAIVGTKGDEWVAKGVLGLSDNKDEKIGKVEYGNQPSITTPKK